MFQTLVVLFLALIFGLKAESSDHFNSLTARGKRAEEVMKELEPQVESALTDYQVPGLAIGVVVDGELVYAKGFGYRDLEKKLSVTTKTLFPIGSCTKAFTAFLVGMYVDQGKLSWDTTAIEILPELRLWNFDATYQLTFRDMLTHQSGLPRHELVWYNSKMDRNELLKKLRYLEPVCHLRQRYIYNNLMYLTAGLALEKISNLSWEELTTEKLLKPLSMNQTNFSVKDLQKSADHALPYREKDHQLVPMAYRDLTIIAPAGSINSNVEDLSRWLKMLVAGGVYEGNTLIHTSSMQEMLLPQVIAAGSPEAQDTAFNSYGIGWSTISYRGHYLVSHDGISDGFTSVVGFLPKEKIGIIVLANKNMTALSRFISMEAIDRILGLSPIQWLKDGIEGLKKTKDTETSTINKEDPSRKKGTFPSHCLEDFTGEYEHPAYGVLTVDLFEGKLRIVHNDIPLILEHWHYDVFAVAEEPVPLILPLVGTKLTFHSNVQGEITELAIPFEPAVKDVVFKRRESKGHTSQSYLRKFVGLYEIYGYTVDIAIKNGVLSAIIPGQPVYELIPVSENEFQVKSKTGYNVRFVMDDLGLVKEVLLMQPYGTFSATPKRT